MYCTGGTECLSRTPGSHSACAIRTPLGVDWEILFVRKELMLSGFLTLNAESILPQAGNCGGWCLSWVRLLAAAGLFHFSIFAA